MGSAIDPSDTHEARRRWLADVHLPRQGIVDRRVLDAMKRVPRHVFVPRALEGDAYDDRPLPLPDGQTISQPFIVALMTQLLTVEPGHRVLELGTGSGYQTAILAELGAEIWSVEQSLRLHHEAIERLRDLGYERIHFVQGDGTVGLPEQAPFDRILATGSLPDVPELLTDQLRDGGLFVAPIGTLYAQTLTRVTLRRGRTTQETFGECRFVPLVGAAGWREPPGKG